MTWRELLETEFDGLAIVNVAVAALIIGFFGVLGAALARWLIT